MRRILWPLCLVLLTAAIAPAQSLADVAAKAKAERDAKAAASKPGTADKAGTNPKTAQTSFTNKDLKPEAAPVATAAGPAASTPAPEKASEAARQDATRTDAKKAENYWRNRMLEAQTRLREDRNQLAAATAQEAALDHRLHVSRDNNAYLYDRVLRAQAESDWQAAVAEVGRLKAAVQSDQEAIAQIEEEARVAGVPPGWLVLK